ncbi:MAG TPA: aminopeptidase [Firmicutes bacterium]|nr:aminopeptidase [Bacillota bacterium]
MVDTARSLLKQNMALKAGEELLVIVDETTLTIGKALFEAGEQLQAKAMLLQMQPTGRSGAEPSKTVAKAMATADVVIAATSDSLSHTKARREASAAGVRIATMPGIKEEMFKGGAMQADYAQVAALARKLAQKLTVAKEAVVEKDGCRLTMSLEERQGAACTGMCQEKGDFGNLPAGEAFIAPMEGTAEGTVIIDGSFAGLGELAGPLKLTFSRGQLVEVEGLDKERLLDLLGDNPLARNLAELGIGTNEGARIIGVVLEDEKVYGTIHLALGSNDGFGGNVAAGIHVDGIIMNPDLYLDGEHVLGGGKILI